jgi:hypothetical protein
MSDSPLHDRKRKQDKDELAKVAPWREHPRDEPACRTDSECCNVCGVRDGQKCGAEDLDEAYRNEQAEEREYEHTHGRYIGWKSAVIVRCDRRPLIPVFNTTHHWMRKERYTVGPTPVNEPNTIPPKLRMSFERAYPVFSNNFCVLMSYPAFPPRPQRRSMQIMVTIHA